MDAREIIRDIERDEQTAPLYSVGDDLANRIIAALEAAGFNLLPPNHIALPQAAGAGCDLTRDTIHVDSSGST